MNISIIGHGKMGKTIEKIALERGHKIVSIIDPNSEKATHREISEKALQGAEVAIDFTSPESAMKNIETVSRLGKSMVMGTTGWESQVAKAKAIIGKSNTGFIYASNFSIGMNIFLKIIENASKIIDRFPEYDIGGVEYHHAKKADSPSGTARSIAEIIKGNVGRKKTINYGAIDGQIKPGELHFASLRIGSMPGTHKIIIDSAPDTIELTHTARNREGFALGAVMAAEWVDKKKGFYNIKDMMKELTG